MGDLEISSIELRLGRTTLFFIRKGLVVLLALIGFEVKATEAQNILRFYSEIAAPYYWLDENGEPQGVNFDLAKSLIELTQVNATIEHLPWARAIHQAANEPNVILISALRTSSREPLFQWLGEVHSVRASLIRLAKNKHIKLTSIEQAKQFLVGSVRGYGAANYLLKRGFIENDNLALVSSTEQLWTMLFKGRIDLVIANVQTGKYEIQSVGLDASEIEPIYDVDELNFQLEMATGLNTNAQVVETLQTGIIALKANGEYQRIMQKWKLQ